MIKKIIKKHQNIIIFSENIEKIYSRIAFVLFLLDTLIICFAGFAIVTVSNQNMNFIIVKDVTY